MHIKKKVVPVEIVTAAMKRVKEIYEIEKELAKKEGRDPDFRKVLHEVVNSHRHLTPGEEKYMLSVIGEFFGQRGGLAPHKKRAEKSKTEEQPEPKKPAVARVEPAAVVTVEPLVINSQTRLDMLNMRRQAHEHICPID